MRNVTDEFVKFALEYADYDKIPAEVIHESKRVLLDGLWCIILTVRKTMWTQEVCT